MAHNRGYGWVQYIISTVGLNLGNPASIKVDYATAANNDTFTTLNPAAGLWFWPLHRSDMRCVYGKDSSSPVHKDSCTAIDPAGTLFKLGSTFVDLESNSYTTYGLRNERFRIRDVK